MKKRKLAAIMFTDIAGYTATMHRSEDEAVKWRDRHREVFDRETERYHGEILQYYGDGTLSVFDSAVNAVECAIAIQNELQKSPNVPLRIGIHSGDILYTDDDIIGDGVNIASRIESLSVVGSVFISDKVYDEIKNSSHIQTQFLKSFNLKNVEPWSITVRSSTLDSSLIKPPVNPVFKSSSSASSDVSLKGKTATFLALVTTPDFDPSQNPNKATRTSISMPGTNIRFVNLTFSWASLPVMSLGSGTIKPGLDMA